MSDARSATPRIVLVRHGRSAHATRGWLDAAGVRRWLDAYDVAGIAADDAPPAALVADAARAGIVVASDLPRAAESAARLAAGRAVRHTPLLREAPLAIPALGPVRLPLGAWALLVRVAAGVRAVRGVVPPADVRARGDEAAALLADLAARHASVLAVTHANVRAHVARALGASGWARVRGGRRYAHWSAWTFTPAREPRPPRSDR